MSLILPLPWLHSENDIALTIKFLEYNEDNDGTNGAVIRTLSQLYPLTK